MNIFFPTIKCQYYIPVPFLFHLFIFFPSPLEVTAKQEISFLRPCMLLWLKTESTTPLFLPIKNNNTVIPSYSHPYLIAYSIWLVEPVYCYLIAISIKITTSGLQSVSFTLLSAFLFLLFSVRSISPVLRKLYIYRL